MRRYEFDPGFDIMPSEGALGFTYGPGVFGPQVENRTLDSIRKSLMDPECDGPDIVYAIAMDVGKEEHKPMLESFICFTVLLPMRKVLLEKSRSEVRGIYMRYRVSAPSPPRKYMKSGLARLSFICRSMQRTIPDAALPYMPSQVMW